MANARGTTGGGKVRGERHQRRKTYVSKNRVRKGKHKKTRARKARLNGLHPGERNNWEKPGVFP